MVTISFHGWMIPVLITVLSIGYALFIYDDGTSGYFSGIGNLLMLIPALFVSGIAWFVYAIFLLITK